MNKNEVRPSPQPSIHPWRNCPAGEHWVREHEMHVPPSSTHPNGTATIRHAHCAKNPSGKDQLFLDEIKEISKTHFQNLKNKPCPIDLGFKSLGTQFDDFIAGWTQYWNDVFGPSEPLEPNVVKALVASESGFIPDKLFNRANPKSARGLMQVTDETRKTLSNEKGEIKDHYVSATQQELNDPSTNICAGVRWLFQKQHLTSVSLGRIANWEETIEFYKGLKNKSAAEKRRTMGRFLDYFERLKKCAK